jgi:hypothetical protein
MKMNSMVCFMNCESDKDADTAEDSPEIRIDKVLSVRRELGEGRYCIFEKLDIVVDRLLEELLDP